MRRKKAPPEDWDGSIACGTEAAAHMSAAPSFSQGDPVRVLKGTHGGKHGTVLHGDVERGRLYIAVKGEGAVSVPTSFCKHIEAT